MTAPMMDLTQKHLEDLENTDVGEEKIEEATQALQKLDDHLASQGKEKSVESFSAIEANAQASLATTGVLL